MFKDLKQRWKVNELNLLLIILNFAAGGSLCGIVGKKILGFTGLEKGFAWIAAYLIVLTLIWPLCVLLVSIPLGQFAFFKNYLQKIWARMSGKKKPPLQIAIFASGAGSNAQKIIKHFKDSPAVKIALIICNKEGAGVLSIAKSESIDSILIERNRFFKEDAYVNYLHEKKVDFIVLAGFLWKIPPLLIQAYPNKIINIHPALLPAYGGKGMYGSNVHEAVIAAKEKQSGISIHYVDELYDHGSTIFQATCNVMENDTAASLAQKIHVLEHTHYPAVIEKLLTTKSPLK